MRKVILILSLIAFIGIGISDVYASCGVGGCTISMLGKSADAAGPSNTKWYFNYLYNQIVWKDKSARQIHELHHQGHDVHNKTTEVTHHYQIGRHVTDDVNIFIDLPFAKRSLIEIDDHARLGDKEKSQGLGDLQLMGEYRFWHNDQHGLGLAGGFQFPTGNTHEKNSQGERFETEFQPGFGAYNYIAGLFYKFNSGSWKVIANTSYVITTKGAQDFEFGDLYTTSLESRYMLNPDSKFLKTEVGVNTVYKHMGYEQSHGVKNPDSGGIIFLLGPSLNMHINDNISLTGTFLYPVSQQLNGLAQEQAFDWILGSQMRF